MANEYERLGKVVQGQVVVGPEAQAERQYDIKRGFTVARCNNGGWVLVDMYGLGSASRPVASFTSTNDLLIWLRDQLKE